MYAYIKGKLVSKSEERIVIECNNIGYEIRVPNKIIEQLPFLNDEVKIYTYLHVREDAQLLYGFLTKEDKEIFQLLIGVSGIGPKGGLSILSVLSCDDLKFAILAGDVKTITSAPGVGAKTAQRLLIELKDKIGLEETFESKLSKEQELLVGNSSTVVRSEAIAALVSLGYSASEAARSIQHLEIIETSTVEDIIRQALKQLTFL